MDSSELIELFYNRAYEKFVNKQILDDKNYIVPRQQLTNYVHELIDIPYIEFIEYLKSRNKNIIVKGPDVTHFSSFPACEIDMCRALIWANNPGCTFVEIGRLFPDKVTSRNDIAYRLYGEKHVKAATQLGLTFEYYDYWYLSCLGYIYPDLQEDERKQLLARTITRNDLFQQMLVDITDHDVYPELYLTMYSGSTLKSRIKSVITFFDICIEECEFNNISTHRLYRRNANIDSSSSLLSSRKKSIYSSFYSYEMLSFEDSITLFQRYELRRDLNAFDTLVKSYLRLVVSTAKLFVGKGLEFDDLIQEGTLGLIRAIEKYDYIKGVSFAFYAKRWIKQYIINAINTQTLIVQIPQNQLILYKKVRNFIEKYEQKNGLIPSITEIEEEENIGQENLSYLDILPDDLHELVSRKDNWDDYPSSEFPVDDIVMQESRIYFVNSLLKKLKHRETEILRCVFGIGVKEKTLEEIGERMNLTRERVRQIKEKAIRRLREIVNISNNNEQDDHEDDEAEEIESTIGEIERKKHVKRMLKRAEKNTRDSSDNPQKKQFKIINKEGTFEIRGANNNLLFHSKGNIKSINGDLYCLRLHFTHLDIYTIKVAGSGFKVGELIVHAPKSSHLYQLLIGGKYDIIKDVKQDYSNNEYKVLVDCKWYDNSGLLIIEEGNRLLEESELSQNEKDKLNNVSPILIDLNELDGIKVGDRIIYNEKECTICKIIVRGDSSRLCVKYDNEVLDYVSNDKSRYRIIRSQTTPQYQTSEENKTKGMSARKDTKEASIGDRILYNSKPCIVLEKSKKYNIVHLVVKYDDGIIDNVLGDKKKYEILNHRDSDYKQELSIHTPQKRRVEKVESPTPKGEILLKRKSREDLYDYYTQLILKLNQAVVHGKKILAKPSLLIAVIDAIGNNEIQHNEIVITSSLEDKYNTILSRFTGKSLLDKKTSIAMPFWHLQSDKFWFLEPAYPNAKNFSPSKKWLIDNIKYARLDDDLWYLLQDEMWRYKLREFIIENKLKEKQNNQIEYIYNGKKKIKINVSNRASQKYAAIGDWIIWKPTRVIGKVVRQYSKGTLHKIVLCTKTGSEIEVYDNPKLYEKIM